MSWKLTVTNQYYHPVSVLGETIKPNTSKALSQVLGNAILDVPGIGQMNFHDIGDKHVGGPGKETWGVLISYQGEEIEYRYEGGGELEVTINWLGQGDLESNGSIELVDLPSFITPHSKVNPTGE